MGYLLIGHISQDVVPGGFSLGGTVSFSGRVAMALGWATSILTSASPASAPILDSLKGISITCISSAATTTFENIYNDEGRRQTLLGVADTLTPDCLPDDLKSSELVHFAPIAQEVSADLCALFPRAVRCATPQGWMRAWDRTGAVRYKRWRDAERVLPLLDAVVLSIEDVMGDEALVKDFSTMSPLLVMTKGKEGCILYDKGHPTRLPTHAVTEIDPTGAGDIFATAFFSEYARYQDPVSAARFALFLATESVQYSGLPREESIIRARRAIYGS